MSRRMPSYDTILELPYVLDDKGYSFFDININNYDEVKFYLHTKEPSDNLTQALNINWSVYKGQEGVKSDSNANKYMFIQIRNNEKGEWEIQYLSIGIENYDTYKSIKVIGVKY